MEFGLYRKITLAITTYCRVIYKEKMFNMEKAKAIERI
jgi:hypothetical protein